MTIPVELLAARDSARARLQGGARVGRFRWHHGAVLALALFAFSMSGLVRQQVFEGLPHLEDELAYFYQARVFARGHATLETPQPSAAYWQPFVVDYRPTGRRFGKYPPGWPALLALGVLSGAPWLVNAFLCALTVILVYRLGLEIFNPHVGVLAALLTACSPAGLLLNATLMSHTAGLFFATAFVYGYWRMERGSHRFAWAAIAGIALGALASTRPLTTLAIGLPFVVYSGVRLLRDLPSVLPADRGGVRAQLRQTLCPLVVLSVLALSVGSSVPWFSYVATGDARQNLYELAWDFDRVGFGEGHGPNGHSLGKGLAHSRFDLSLTAVDLFGWQLEPLDDAMIRHLQSESDDYPGHGLSFLLLPVGLLIGTVAFADRHRRLLSVLIAAWFVVAAAWVLVPLHLDAPLFGTTPARLFGIAPDAITQPGFSWLWLTGALVWLLLPLAVLDRWRSPQATYTWLLFGIVLGVVLVHMTYWVGSQRYSTRYYYEGLTAAALITAVAGAGLARTLGRNVSLVLYAFLLLAVICSLRYSMPRLAALRQLNGISRDLIEAVEARRHGDRPLLVIVSGASTGPEAVSWRAYAELMALTSPYLDSDIVAARDFGKMRAEILARFPERQVIDLYAKGDRWTVEQQR